MREEARRDTQGCIQRHGGRSWQAKVKEGRQREVGN
jgi:hypothetical protein